PSPSPYTTLFRSHLIGGDHDIDRERLRTFCLGNPSASEVPGEALVDLLGGRTDATVIAEKRSRFGAERFGLRPVGSRDDDLGRRPGRKLRFAETVIVEPFARADAACALRRRHAEHDVVILDRHRFSALVVQRTLSKLLPSTPL